RDRGRDLAGLAVADAHETVAVAHDDERREAEAAAALDDLRDAVDRDDALEELVLRAVVAAAALVAGAAVAAPAALLARLVAVVGRRRGLSSRLLRGVRHLRVLVLFAHGPGPASRAPSAIAATRPA